MSQGFEHWTERDIAEREQRLFKRGQVTKSEACQVESELHEQIRNACASRGWLPLHGSMAHKTFRTPGEWDFVILAEYPRLFLVECKTKDGKQTKDQAVLEAWAKKLGWKPTVVRSMSEFWAYVSTY